MSRHDKGVRVVFGKLAMGASAAAGSVWAFGIALATIAVWGLTGPLFHFSDTWQLVINTGTTIVTFLMVFLIQHAQNRDMRAVQLKLDELIACTEGGSNRLIDVEDLSEDELEHLHKQYRRLAHEAERLHPGAKTSVDVRRLAKKKSPRGLAAKAAK
jgi:low affinity Fe/Cu permease